nr:BTB/POZ domain-containing protein At5g41330 [Ipomoea batatas]
MDSAIALETSFGAKSDNKPSMSLRMHFCEYVHIQINKIGGEIEYYIAKLAHVKQNLAKRGENRARSRTVKLSSRSAISESQFYGVEQLLINSQSNPSQFDPFNLEKSMVLPLNGRDSPASISTTQFGTWNPRDQTRISRIPTSRLAAPSPHQPAPSPSLNNFVSGVERPRSASENFNLWMTEPGNVKERRRRHRSRSSSTKHPLIPNYEFSPARFQAIAFCRSLIYLHSPLDWSHLGQQRK